MEAFFWLVLIVIVLFIVAATRSRKKSQPRPPSSGGGQSARQAAPSASATQWRSDPNAPWQPGPSAGVSTPHVPARPSGVPVEPWSASRRSIEVVGENYRTASFSRLMGSAINRAGGVEIDDPAALADDSRNPHDSNAVAVYVRGEHVGYLDRATAREYHGAVAGLSEVGQHLVVPARTWARSDGSRIYARVTVFPPEPSGIRPVNELPSAPHVVIPTGSTIQVTKEDEHMDALVPWLDHGTERPVAVTLHTVQEQRARSTVETVEVRLDGARVGVLSATQAANMLPLVRHVEERDLVPVARAVLRGNELKADVVLSAAKAQDVDPAWLIALGPPAARPSTTEAQPGSGASPQD